jgi:hypothetical protein
VSPEIKLPNYKIFKLQIQTNSESTHGKHSNTQQRRTEKIKTGGAEEAQSRAST